jgi:hypothetical protein
MKKYTVAVVVMLTACGSKSSVPHKAAPNQTPAPVATPAAAVVSAAAPIGKSSGPLPVGDQLLAQLESLRPFVVSRGGKVDCGAYKPAASAIVKTIPDAIVAALAEREKSLTTAIDTWQGAHNAALVALVSDIGEPLRNDAQCDATRNEDGTRS